MFINKMYEKVSGAQRVSDAQKIIQKFIKVQVLIKSF